MVHRELIKKKYLQYQFYIRDLHLLNDTESSLYV
jgi:hypothetical protein